MQQIQEKIYGENIHFQYLEAKLDMVSHLAVMVVKSENRNSSNFNKGEGKV